MTNQSLTISTSREPPPPPRELRDYLASCRNAVEWTNGQPSISAQRIPTGAARRALLDRRELLARTSGASDPETVGQRVMRLFARFPQSKPEPSMLQMTLQAYAHDLAKFPLWAIDKAIGDMLATEARAFMPSALELRRAVELAAAAARHELADLEVVIAAEPIAEPDPDSKAKVADAMKNLVAELKQNADPLDAKRRPLTRDEAQAALERIDPSVPPPGFSPALRKLLVQQGHLAAEPVRVPEPEDRGYPEHD